MDFPSGDIASVVGAALAALLVYAWQRIRGKKEANVVELLDEAITAEVVEALNKKETTEELEVRLRRAAQKLMDFVGFKLPQTMVNTAIQWGLVEFKRLAQERQARQDIDVARLEKAIVDLAAALDKVKVPVPVVKRPDDGTVYILICKEPGCGKTEGHEGDHGPAAPQEQPIVVTP